MSDFLVEEDILIEVKAIELHPRAGVLRTKDILINDLDQTIIKAYKQLLETAKKLNPERQHYGVVVTYKEMYLGFGADAWEEFLKEPMEAFCLQHSIDLSILPAKNLCFVSIEDWDKMMQAVKDGKATLKEILFKGIALNAVESVVDSIGMMEQAINQFYHPQEYTLSYLKDIHLTLDILPNKIMD